MKYQTEIKLKYKDLYNHRRRGLVVDLPRQLQKLNFEINPPDRNKTTAFS